MASTIKFTPGNIISSFGWLIPQILAIIAVFLPIFNGSPQKSIVFMMLSGLLIAIGAISSYKDTNDADVNSLLCNMFYLLDDTTPDCPSKNSLFVSFTCIYLISPMILYNTYNYWALCAILLFLMCHIVHQKNSGCSSVKCYLPAIFWGGLMGYLSVYFIALAEYEELLYFNELANNKVVCNKTLTGTNKCKT